MRVWGLVAALALLGGCAEKEQTTTRVEKQHVTLNLSDEPPSLDPSKTRELIGMGVVTMLFDGLYRIGADGQPQAAVAESVHLSEDQRVYTFHLRDSFWSNGDPVTAYDFEYAWKRALSPQSPSEFAFLLDPIRGAAAARSGKASIDSVEIKALDTKTLQVTLVRPVPFFLSLTALPEYFPINHKIDSAYPHWAQNADDHYVSNGPFALVSWKHGDEIQLIKNNRYWDAQSVSLDEVALVMVSDANTELEMFGKQELDWAGSPLSALPVDAINALRAQGKLAIYPAAGTCWYKLNTERPPFDNVKMRLAFAYAIDRHQIVEHITQAGELPATGPIPPALSYRTQPLFRDGDQAAARTLFEEALVEMGLTRDQLPPIVLSHRNAEKAHKLAEAIQQQWREALGIEVQLEAMEWRVLLSRMAKHDYQIGAKTWFADFMDPVGFLEPFKQRGGANETQWENPRFAHLLDAAEQSTHPEARLQLLREAEALFVQEMPAIPLFHATFACLKNGRLQNVLISPVGVLDLKSARLMDPAQEIVAK